MCKEKFVITSDKDVAHKMTQAGADLVCIRDYVWYFVNSGKLNFDESERSKVSFTNILPI